MKRFLWIFFYLCQRFQLIETSRKLTLVCHAAHVNKVERILPSNIFVEA